MDCFVASVPRKEDMRQQKSAGRARAFRQIHRIRKLLADGSSLRAVLLLLDDAGRLAAQLAQVIQLGAAHLAAAHHGDRVDHRRHHGEYAFHAFAVGNLAHREAFVKPSASAWRQAATRAWSPDNRISGIGRPSNSCGRVYCGYSRSPSEKLSSAPEISLPITPGSSRTQASISVIAAISPPDST